MDLIYLDYNCFQRGFDDPQQIKIQLEALACEEIFAKTERKDIKLVWSFVHEDENILCPFLERKLEGYRLSSLCKTRVGPDKKNITSPKTSKTKQNCLLKMRYIWHVHTIPKVNFS
jgi:hypothetical protein